MSEMRILTVRQPWAWAIIHGGKDVENRVRNIAGDYRGPVAIHAGIAYDEDAHIWPNGSAGPIAIDEDASHRATKGVILGVVDIAGVHGAEDCIDWREVAQGHIDHEWCSPWALADHQHLELVRPRPLTEPIPFKGALGLRRLDEETTAAIWSQILGGER